MNKLLISLLSLTGVAGITTGSYFLLRNNYESDKKSEQETELGSGGSGSGSIGNSGGTIKDVAPETPSGVSGSGGEKGVPGNGQSPQV